MHLFSLLHVSNILYVVGMRIYSIMADSSYSLNLASNAFLCQHSIQHFLNIFQPFFLSLIKAIFKPHDEELESKATTYLQIQVKRINLLIKKQVSMIRTCHNHIPQNNPKTMR